MAKVKVAKVKDIIAALAAYGMETEVLMVNGAHITVDHADKFTVGITFPIGKKRRVVLFPSQEVKS